MATLLRFTPEMLALVPARTGAYFLFRDSQPIFAGMAACAATLRSELTEHLRGAWGEPTCAATHFAWVATDDAMEAYRLQCAAHARWDLRPSPKRASCSTVTLLAA